MEAPPTPTPPAPSSPLPSSPSIQGKSKEEELEENIRQSINFAKDVFAIATNEKYMKSTTPETRYEELCKRYPEFAKAYPVVINKIAQGFYNERAFRRFLNRQRENPGKGMEGFIERQADYAKFLYEEECKAKRRHINMKEANLRWEMEHRQLKKWIKNIKKDEEEMKNQFEDEQKDHLDARRDELLRFINAESPAEPEQAMPDIDNYEEPENTEGMAPIKDVAPSLIDIDGSTMNYEEMKAFYKDMEKYYEELIDGITGMNERIHELERLHEVHRLEEEDLQAFIAKETAKTSAPRDAAKPAAAVAKKKSGVTRDAKAEARRKANEEIEALIRQNGLEDKSSPGTASRRAQRV